MASNDNVQKYFDSLLSTYDILVEAVEKAGERGLHLTKQFATDVTKGQRDAIELGRKLAADPGDAGRLYSALLEATTAVQGRALAFTQAAYVEALGAGTEARETIEKLVEANKDTTQVAVDVAKKWAAAHPFADAMKKGFETAQPRAAKAKKEKAAV